MAIGGAVTSGTPGSVLFIGASGVLAQDNANFFWDDSADILSLAGTSPGALRVYNTNDHAGNFERGVFDWNTTANVLTIGTQAGGTGVVRPVRIYSEGYPTLYGDHVNGNSYAGFSGPLAISLPPATGTNNAAIGALALVQLTSGSSNMAIGASALNSLSTGSGNLSVGFASAQSLTTANNNVAFGGQALSSLTTGSNNAALGANALKALQGSANTNTALGVGAFPNLQIGNSNTGVGFQVGATMTSGNINTLVGVNAAQNFASGSNFNTVIGSFPGPAGVAWTSLIAIAEGGNYNGPQVNWNYTTAFTWTFGGYDSGASAIHIYSSYDGLAPPTNYERGIMSWRKTSNVFRVGTEAGGTGTIRILAMDGFQKAGAPAAGDLPSGTFALINDTSGGQTWLVYNAAGTIRKVQLV
jgi:hypothetical protein